MRMSAREIWGGIATFLASPRAVPPARIRFAANTAIQRMHNQLKDQWSRKTEDIAYLDLVADKDIYDIPEPIHHITKVERFDLNTDVVRVFPLSYHRHDEPDELGANIVYRYVLHPNRKLRFVQIPSGSMERGARITHLPMGTKLVGAGDVPDLPEDLHENVILEAVAWLAASGAALRDPDSFASLYAQRQDDAIRYLNPDEHDQPPGVIEDYPIYEPEWDPFI